MRFSQQQPRLSLSQIYIVFAAFFSATMIRHGVYAQSQQQEPCLSLDGSRACPAFAQYNVPLTDISSRHPFLADVLDLDSFDQALFSYAKSSGSYLDTLGCHKPDEAPYARYSLTRLCASIIHDDSYFSADDACNTNTSLQPTPLPAMCQRSCYEWLDSVSSLTVNRCSDITARANGIFDLIDECTDWMWFNGTDSCISGADNEPDNCGYQWDTAEACRYCRTNQTDPCCSSMSCDGLSGGAIAGIAVGSVVGAAIAVLAVFWLCSMRRRMLRRESSNKHFDFKTYEAAPADEDDEDRIRTDSMGSRLALLTATGPIAAASNRQTPQHHYHGNTTPANSAFGGGGRVMDDPEKTAEVSSAVTPPLSPPQQPRPEDLYLAVHSYPPQMGDELALHPGDLICLAVRFDDGWAIGFNVMTGLKGAFPLVCVAPAPLDLLSDDTRDDDASSKVLVEEDCDDNVPVGAASIPMKTVTTMTQQQSNGTGTTVSALPPRLKLLDVDRIREKVRRSVSLDNLKAAAGSSPATIPQHGHIPRRTASMRNSSQAAHYGYSEADSPTSPTLTTPFFDVVAPLSKAVVRPPLSQLMATASSQPQQDVLYQYDPAIPPPR